MSRRKGLGSFEDILNQEFRWPRKGDRPFVSTKAGVGDAYLEDNASIRLAAMSSGYKDAADELVDRTRSDPITRNSLVYPIIFCYRHYLELTLKTMIAQYGRAAGMKPIWNTHDLTKLWGAFVKMRGQFLPDSDEADAIVADCVAQFAKIDPDFVQPEVSTHEGWQTGPADDRPPRSD